MTAFLIKSAIALLALLAFYHLVLEKEKIHRFNRFYLLLSILFSFVVPFINIEIIDESAKVLAPSNTVVAGNVKIVTLAENINYTPVILWSIYGIITSLLLIRFTRNILKIKSRIKSNTVIDYKNAKLVLLKEKTLPYTFGDTIFINEEDYCSKKIEAELFTHELIHVNQKHSLDVLLIEIIKTVFWFNPIFIFYKKAIQLNHEFLADEKVVQSHNNVSFYQNLLLEKANQSPIHYLASNLNYYVTKKRLIMMTTTTSVLKGFLKKTILLPLLTGLVYFLCTKTVAQEVNPKTTSTKEQKKNSLSFKDYYDNTTFKIKDDKGIVLKEKKYNELTPAEKKMVPTVFEGSKFPPNKEEINQKLEKGGPEYVDIDPYDPKNIKEKKADGAIYNTAEITENPDYPGGMEMFYKFVGENYKTPITPMDINLKGKVYITFIVEKDGALSNFKLLRDIGYGTGEEAIRVLKLSPNWIPGKVNGEAVATMYSLPITIRPKE